MSDSFDEPAPGHEHRAGQVCESEARYRLLFDTMSQGVVLRDANGAVVAVNPAALRILGLTWEQFGGRTPLDVYFRFTREDGTPMPGEDHPSIVALRTGREVRDVVVGFTHEQLAETRWSLVSALPQFRPGEDRPYQVYTTFSDVTALRGAEQALRLREEQLRAAQQLEAVGRLAGGVAHDFNNTLMAITGHAEMLLEDLGDEHELRGSVLEIRTLVNHSAAVTRQLLAFSRTQQLQPRLLDVNALVRRVEPMLRRYSSSRVELNTALADDVGMVHADAGQLEQVLVSLVMNAHDALPNGGRIELTTVNEDVTGERVAGAGILVPGRYVRLDVADTGTGIPPEVLPRIFEPFFSTKPAGTGLGLSSAYGVIAQSGGHMCVSSQPGRGTTFQIFLPRATAAAPADTTAAPRVLGGTETLLLVEDDPAVQEMVKRALSRRGYNMLVACDGTDALRVAQQHDGPIDLLVTDMVMPGMNGREVADRLSGVRPGLRVLYMSGYSDSDLANLGVLEPGAAFIEKPCSPEALARRVRELLNASPAVATAG